MLAEPASGFLASTSPDRHPKDPLWPVSRADAAAFSVFADYDGMLHVGQKFSSAPVKLAMVLPPVATFSGSDEQSCFAPSGLSVDCSSPLQERNQRMHVQPSA